MDNASAEPLAQDAFVPTWLSRTPGARVVREDVLGLSHARLRAFREAQGNLVVCFDDDNVPASDYLDALLDTTSRYPFVGVWGPGRIDVEWLPGADPRVVADYALNFQQHDQDMVT